MDRTIWRRGFGRWVTSAISGLGIMACGFAVPPQAHAERTPVTSQCFIHAARIHHLPLTIVLALMRTEGGRPGTVHLNSDRYHSHDLGVMQVNDRTWIPEIAERDFGGDRKAAIERIRDDGCYNVLWGTEIFARYVDEANGQYWLAVGYYNSHYHDARIAYTRTVVARYREVMKDLHEAIRKRQIPQEMQNGGY